jgi:hypothetical protein
MKMSSELQARHGETMLNANEFTPALPSRASRYIALRAKGHFSGALVIYCNQTRQIVVFESRLELHTAYTWSTRPDVVDLFDQVRLKPWIDEQGREHQHTLDYLAIMADGRRIGLSVKPEASANRRNLRQDLAQILAQNGDMLDEIRLVTEKSFSREQVENAELIHFVLSECDDEADQIVADLIGSLTGTTTIEAVVNASGLEGRAFRSVIRMVGRGICRQVSQGRLRYPTLIGRA